MTDWKYTSSDWGRIRLVGGGEIPSSTMHSWSFKIHRVGREVVHMFINQTTYPQEGTPLHPNLNTTIGLPPTKPIWTVVVKGVGRHADVKYVVDSDGADTLEAAQEAAFRAYCDFLRQLPSLDA